MIVGPHLDSRDLHADLRRQTGLKTGLTAA